MINEEAKLMFGILVPVVALAAIVSFLCYRYPMRTCVICGHRDFNARMSELEFMHVGKLVVCGDCETEAMMAIMAAHRGSAK